MAFSQSTKAKYNIFNQDNYRENKRQCMCRFHSIITICRLKAQSWAQAVDLHIITGIDVISLAENRTQIVRFHCINVVDVCPWLRWWDFTVNVDFCTWLWLVPRVVWFHFMDVVNIWLDSETEIGIQIVRCQCMNVIDSCPSLRLEYPMWGFTMWMSSNPVLGGG